MNADDTLYGRIKNGVLTLSGNNSSIRVDGGCLVVSDGPTAVDPAHKGKSPPLEQRMATLRLRRAACPVSRIVVTRPDGFITFGAIKWLHGVGASLVQLDWDGTVLLATAPPGTDQPTLRRAQALAAGNATGLAIMREVLRGKLTGQASVARSLGNHETAELITELAKGLSEATTPVRLLAIEATAATAYWSLWATVQVQFARRYTVPEHWQHFGARKSPLSEGPRKAATPANAILNYLFGVVSGEITVALAGAGLDPGIGIFHTDKYHRASLAYDAIEAIRPYVEGWLLSWLAEARFAKRDFYEEQDGTVRVTRPLISHLAATAPIWRPAARAVAEWLARAIAEGDERCPRLGRLLLRSAHGMGLPGRSPELVTSAGKRCQRAVSNSAPIRVRRGSILRFCLPPKLAPTWLTRMRRVHVPPRTGATLRSGGRGMR